MRGARFFPRISEVSGVLRIAQWLKDERDRRGMHTFGASVASRVINSGIRLLMIPASVRILGHERYGLWLAATSLVAWLGLTDLGFGGGLVNAVGAAYGRRDFAAIRRHVSAARCYYGAMAAIVAVLAWGLASLPGSEFLVGAGGRPHLRGQGTSLILVLGLLQAGTVYASRIYAIALAVQQGYWSQYCSILASALSLLGLIGLAARPCSLTTFALVMGLPQLAVAAALTVFLNARAPFKDLRPHMGLCTLESLRALSGFAVPVFWAQLAEVALTYSANLLIANRFGPAEVPRYAVPSSLYQFVGGTFGVLLQAYWPAFVEASHRSDWVWLRSASRRTLVLAVLGVGVGNVAVVAAGDAVVERLAGRQALPGQALLVCLAVYGVTATWAYGAGMVALGLGWLKLRAGLRLFSAAVHIFGFFWLAPVLGLLAFPVAGMSGLLTEAAVLTWMAERRMRVHLHGPSGALVKRGADRSDDAAGAR